MVDMRRRTPEPAPGVPEIQYRPGLADDLLQELAPLLAGQGIDVQNLGASDLATLERSLHQAVERRNLQLFTPVGASREVAVTAIRLVVTACCDDDPATVGALLDQVEPESPDNTVATVASCIGLGLGLLDDWLSGRGDEAPSGLAQHVRLPVGPFTGERAATEILALARKGRAFRSLKTLLARQGGQQVLAGSALALAAAVTAWADHGHTPRAELIRTAIR